MPKLFKDLPKKVKIELRKMVEEIYPNHIIDSEQDINTTFVPNTAGQQHGGVRRSDREQPERLRISCPDDDTIDCPGDETITSSKPTIAPPKPKSFFDLAFEYNVGYIIELLLEHGLDETAISDNRLNQWREAKANAEKNERELIASCLQLLASRELTTPDHAGKTQLDNLINEQDAKRFSSSATFVAEAVRPRTETTTIGFLTASRNSDGTLSSTSAASISRDPASPLGKLAKEIFERYELQNTFPAPLSQRPDLINTIFSYVPQGKLVADLSQYSGQDRSDNFWKNVLEWGKLVNEETLNCRQHFSKGGKLVDEALMPHVAAPLGVALPPQVPEVLAAAPAAAHVPAALVSTGAAAEPMVAPIPFVPPVFARPLPTRTMQGAGASVENEQCRLSRPRTPAI
jgi:hypothetical protein